MTSLLALLAPTAALPCGLALVLAVDVSGSVNTNEYRVQMDGLAAALRDGIVADALVDEQAQVTLIQWTGSTRQRQTIPWRAMRSLNDVLDLADAVEADQRAGAIFLPRLAKLWRFLWRHWRRWLTANAG